MDVYLCLGNAVPGWSDIRWYYLAAIECSSDKYCIHISGVNYLQKIGVPIPNQIRSKPMGKYRNQTNLWLWGKYQLLTESTASYTLVRIDNTNQKHWDWNTKYQVGIDLVLVYQKVGIRLTSLINIFNTHHIFNTIDIFNTHIHINNWSAY